jgi:hypothetical protein
MPPVRRLTALETLLAVLVVLFAFAAASFAVRNSDFWLHLASGRDIAAGKWTVGVDPFAYTTEGVYWVNHAWLFDLLLHVVYQSAGGAALVVLKALLVAALALLLLQFRASGRPLWVTAGCALLALLTMRPRLLVQPAGVSVLLLGLVLWLLWRRGRGVYVLPVLFALWVNLDGCFLLGIALVGVVCVSERLGLRMAGQPLLPAWLLPACLAACLLNPHHVFVFRLPDELSPAPTPLLGDPRFAGLFASPWRLAPLAAAGGHNLTAYAFFLLLGLGVLSFVYNRAACCDWRLPVFLLVAGLAAWQVRQGGFFAVVAGPITALNFSQVLSVAAGPRLVRFGLVVTALVLLGLTWPGWLQGFHGSQRPLAWSVQPDPSLERAARTLVHWRDQGRLPAGKRVFAVHPDVAHYCAWFAQGEKSFIDSRFSLFRAVLPSYEEVCAVLGLRPTGPTFVPSQLWQQTLDEYDVACVVLYDPDVRRLGGPLTLAARDRTEWPILEIAGQAVLLGYGRGAERSPVGPPFDADQLAFSEQAEDNSPLPPAPEDFPGRLRAGRSWWERFTQRPSGSAWEREAAAVYLRLFEERASAAALVQQRRVYSREAAGMVGVAALPAGPAATATLLASRTVLRSIFLPERNDLPPGLPLLAVRAARRAVTAHPDDARAWLLLGQAYLTLGHGTAEARPDASPVPLDMVRHVQTVTALHQALLCDPDLVPAHEALALLYTQRRYLDLALSHRARQLHLTRAAGPVFGEEPSAFARRLERLEGLVDVLEREVQDQENRFVVRAHRLADNPLARAQVALDLGLAGKALDDVLLRSQFLLFGAEGARLQLQLLLMTGRAEQVRQFLDDEDMRRSADVLGVFEMPAGPGQSWVFRLPAYDWFSFCQAAAAGQYGRAGAVLARLRALMAQQRAITQPVAAARLVVCVATEVGVTAQWQGLAVQAATRLERARAARQGDAIRFLQIEQADLYVLEALLDLERGATGPVAQRLGQAEQLYAGAKGLPRPGRRLANAYRAALSRQR